MDQGIAIKPSGSASAGQPIRLRRPMPGSIKMATVPDLNSPRTTATKSMPRPTSGQPRTGRGADHVQTAGDPVAVVVKLAKGDVAIEPLSLRIISQRLDHGDGVGPRLTSAKNAGRHSAVCPSLRMSRPAWRAHYATVPTARQGEGGFAPGPIGFH